MNFITLNHHHIKANQSTETDKLLLAHVLDLLLRILSPKTTKPFTRKSSTMISLKPYQPPFISNTTSKLQKIITKTPTKFPQSCINVNKFTVRACVGQGGGEKKKEKRSFLTLEEAGLVEISGLTTHERFLCRLTISSLNLLRVISEQEGCSIEELNAGRVCDWFLKDKLKREQNIDSAVLQWDDSELQF